MTDETDKTPPDHNEPEPLQFPKIEGLGESRNGHRKRIFRCGDCRFFSPNLSNIKTGFCHGEPPQMLVNQAQGQVMVMRPQIRSDDIACHLLVLSE